MKNDVSVCLFVWLAVDWWLVGGQSVAMLVASFNDNNCACISTQL